MTAKNVDLSELAAVLVRAKALRCELALTVHAARRGRRTPEEVQRVIKRAQGAVHRSVVVRWRWQQRRRVH